MTTLTLRQIERVKELSEYDHCFLSPEGVNHFTEPFGFKGVVYEATDTSKTDPKGLKLDNGLPAALGQDADYVAVEIAKHLGLTPPPLFGRGARLREACRVILDHLEAQQKN